MCLVGELKDKGGLVFIEVGVEGGTRRSGMGLCCCVVLLKWMLFSVLRFVWIHVIVRRLCNELFLVL